jgi:large subunit ribosomal protein L25
MIQTTLNAELRDEHGRGASRRLRRNGSIPAIIYGLDADALAVTLDHNIIYHSLKREEFHTSILTVDINGKKEKVLLRDFQVHAFRQQVLHLDFQRVNDKEEINIRVPLHFINEDASPAVSMQNAHLTHVVTDVEIRAFAKDIPHFIEVDLKDIKAGQSIHLSDLVLPAGISLVNLTRGEDSVVTIAAGIAEEKETEISAVAVGDIPTVGGAKAEEA